jgi:hypothetical protein
MELRVMAPFTNRLLSREFATRFGGPSALPQGGGSPQPSPGYVFLQGKQADGSYVVLTMLNPDNSRTNLQGKAA